MTGADNESKCEDAGANPAINAVLEQQRRLAAELAPVKRDSPVPSGATDPFERMLCEILASVGWRGEQHRIFEALPHLDPIHSVAMLRTVLVRLGVNMIPIERRSSRLSDDDLPCFIVAKEGNCRLLRLGEEAKVEAFDLHQQPRRKANRAFATGAVYLIRAAEAAEASASGPPKAFVGSLLGRMRGSLVRIMAYSAAVNVVGLILSLYSLLVYDCVISTGSLDTLAFLVVGALAGLVLESRLRHARSRAIAYLAARFDGVVSVHALASVLNMPLAQTERAPIASQLSRFRQFEIGRELFAGNFASALFDLPFTLVFLIALFMIGGLLGFVPVGLSLLIVIFCALIAPISAAQMSRMGASKLKSDTLLLELTDKLRTIRNASAEGIWLTRYASSLAAYQHAKFGNNQLALSLQTITGGIVGIAGIVTLGVGSLRVLNGAMSMGELVAAMMIVWRVLVPVQIVSLNMLRIKQTLATARQINDVSRIGNERGRPMSSSLPRRLNGDLLVSGAYLSLGGQPEPQLRGINLSVKAGEIVAITGGSGSGKSTLLKLILGLYPQYMGTVRFDGFDLRQLDPAEVRAAVGYASQQPALFHGSIAANFRFASPGATDADIIESLAAVGVPVLNPAFPDGLATRISSTESRAISQGLLCRLSIARALVKRSPILLFDDLGNGLDRAGDAAFLAHLATLKGKTTVLMVTARPSHMRIADRVLEMRSGVIVTDGPPEIVIPKILARMTDAA